MDRVVAVFVWIGILTVTAVLVTGVVSAWTHLYWLEPPYVVPPAATIYVVTKPTPPPPAARVVRPRVIRRPAPALTPQEIYKEMLGKTPCTNPCQ